MSGGAFSAISDAVGGVSDAASAAAGLGAADAAAATGDITAAFAAGGPQAFLPSATDLAGASTSVFPGIANAVPATAGQILSSGNFGQIAGLGGAATGTGFGAGALGGASPAAQALAGAGNPAVPSLSAPAVSQPPPAVTGGAGAAGAGTSGTGGAAAVAAPSGVQVDPANYGLNNPNVTDPLATQTFGSPSLGPPTASFSGDASANTPMGVSIPQPPLSSTGALQTLPDRFNGIPNLRGVNVAGPIVPDTSALSQVGQNLGDIGAGASGVAGSSPGTTGYIDPAYGSFVPPAGQPPSSDTFNTEFAPTPALNQLSQWGIQTPSLAGVPPTLGSSSPLAGSVTTGGGDLGSNIAMNVATPSLPAGTVATGGGDLGSTAAMTAQLQPQPNFGTDFSGGESIIVPSQQQILAQAGGPPVADQTSAHVWPTADSAGMWTPMSPDTPATPVPPDQMLVPQIPNSPAAGDYVAATQGGPTVAPGSPAQVMADAQARAVQPTDIAPFANAPADTAALPAGYNPATAYLGNAPLAGSSDWQRVASTPVATTNIGGATADLSPTATPATPAASADASRAVSPGINDVIANETLTNPYGGAAGFAQEQSTGLFPGTPGAPRSADTVAQLDTATPSAVALPYASAPASQGDVSAPEVAAAAESPSAAGGAITGAGSGGRSVATGGSDFSSTNINMPAAALAGPGSAASSATAGKPWWMPYTAPAAALGAGAATLALSPSSPLSGIFGGGSSFPGTSSTFPYPGEAQIAQEAQQAQTQGAQLQAYLASGTLPPGLQASLKAAQADAITAIKSKYAGMGMSGSSAEQQDIQNLQQRIVAQSGDMALQLFQQGVSENQLSSQLYTEIMNATIAQDQALSQSISGIAGALASLAVPLIAAA